MSQVAARTANMNWIYAVVLLAACGVVSSQTANDTTLLEVLDTGDGVLDANSTEVEESTRKLSDQVRAILEHFKQSDPVGFPGADVPDPMPVPDMPNKSFAIATMTFINVTVNGLSKFRFASADSDLAAMKMEVGVRIDRLLVLGNYTLSTWLSCSKGGFTVVLDEVLVSGEAKLEVGPGGRLRAEDISLDVTFEKIDLNFENLGYMMSLFQGILNKVGSFLFDSIKPLILSEVNAGIRVEVDRQVSAIALRFPSSMAPLDVLVADARRFVRDMGLDPYRFLDYKKEMGLLSASVTNIYATGLSSFYRVGNLSLWMRDHVLHAGLHVGTRQIKGQCHWEIASYRGFMSRTGQAVFTVDYLQAQIVVNQSLDVRQHPYLESLNLNLGNIQINVDGAGKLDHLVEFAVNVLPNLLRYQIVNALETPIMERVQLVLDTVDVEKIIHDKLPELDNLNTA